LDVDYQIKIDGNTSLEFDSNPDMELGMILFYNTETFEKTNMFIRLFKKVDSKKLTVLIKNKMKNIQKIKIEDDNIIPVEGQTPIQVTYYNDSDETIKVSAFEIFCKNNDNVKIKLPVDYVNMDFLKRYFHDNPHLSGLIRLHCNDLMGKQSEKPFYQVVIDAFGYMAKIPAFIPIDCISKHQFQSGILDTAYSFVLDGISSDLEFDLEPKKMFCLTMFFDYKLNEVSKKSLKALKEIAKTRNSERFNFQYLASVVVENNSDVAKELTLLDIDKYKEEYANDPDLKMYDLFNQGYLRVCESYLHKSSSFNSIRVYGSSGLKQIYKAIEFNSGGKYFPAIEVNGNQFQSCINDVNIVGEELSTHNPMRVTVMPNTRVVYLFKKHENITATTEFGRFINVDVENASDIGKKDFDVMSFNKEDKSVLHYIGKNKMHFNEDTIDLANIRIQFYNESQIENPIAIKVKGGVIDVIHPVCYFNEYNMQGNIIEIPVSIGKININDLEIITDLPNKGDGMNILLIENSINIVNQHVPPFGHIHDFGIGGVIDKKAINPCDLIPVWIENTTDESKEVEFVNDISEYKGFPDGVECDSYEKLLNSIKSTVGYRFDSLTLVKWHTNNINQITSTANLIHDTDKNSEPIDANNKLKNKILLESQSYFSANQFQSCALSFGNGYKLFDLNRVDLLGNPVKAVDAEGKVIPLLHEDETKISRKQKFTFTLLPKTKLCLMFYFDKIDIGKIFQSAETKNNTDENNTTEKTEQGN
jgi:hypothetical protein